MKLPFIAIKTEDNQQDIYEYLHKNNFLTLEKFDTEKLSKKTALLSNRLTSTLLNFTDISLEEQSMVLEWRNHDKIRKWMHNREIIEYQNHIDYIKSLDTREDRVYFLVKKRDRYIGVVDLMNIKKDLSAELGIYTNPSLKGFGKLLLSKIIEYAFEELNLKRLEADVYIQNIPAITLYKKFNFKIIQTIEDRDEKLHKMELKNEDR